MDTEGRLRQGVQQRPVEKVRGGAQKASGDWCQVWRASTQRHLMTDVNEESMYG